MIVLKIIGWVLLGILGLIVLALCVKLRITAEYSDENTHVELGWLFLRIPLYPKKEKPPKKKKKKAGKEEPEEEKPEEEKPEEEKQEEEAGSGKKKESFLHALYRSHGVDGILELVRKLCSYLKTFMGGLFRSLVVEQLYLEIGCAKGDAAATAVYYGEVCSALWPMLGALASRCKLRKYDINIYPDYLARFSKASFYVKLHVYPIYVTGIGLALVFRLVFKLLLGMLLKIFLPKKQKKAEKEKYNERKGS